MDAVTRLIEKNFAGQLGDWCKAHGVEYIGHIWEDKFLSYALGGGLGHYFRAMHGNHMGGVDVVFNAQMHPWSQHSTRDSMGGDFYYYVLGKLASSHAHIDPRKQGRALCEIFGATGWDFGVDKMKYLADNFLVSGINRYVDVMGSAGEWNRNVARLDGVNIREVPVELMKSAYTFTEGWEPAAGAVQINMIIVDPEAVAAPVKYEVAMMSEPTAQSKGKYLYYERYYYGAFRLNNRAGGIIVNAAAS